MSPQKRVGQRPVFGFLEVMQATFGNIGFVPAADGLIHRFHVPGDRVGSHNGWYLLFADGVASGCFGSWKVGVVHYWSSREPADQWEAQLIGQRIEQAKSQREAERHQRQHAAAEYAGRLWREAPPVANHPYLIRKRLQPHNLRQRGDVLLVPLWCGSALVNLQRIHPDGTKRFLFGGMVKGCCSLIGTITPGQPLYICEGWATGATIRDDTLAAVACAMNAGNLLDVGQRLQRQHPDAVLIIAGDDDRTTEGNPGRTAAIKAAATLGCGLVMPPWSGAEPLELSDFNDLANWRAAQ